MKTKDKIALTVFSLLICSIIVVNIYEIIKIIKSNQAIPFTPQAILAEMRARHKLAEDVAVIKVIQFDEMPRGMYKFILLCRFKNGFDIGKLGNVAERDVVNGLIRAEVVNLPDHLKLNDNLEPKKKIKVYTYKSDVANFPMVIYEENYEPFYLIGFLYKPLKSQ
ncbi:MAG: hypothetical protein WC789_10255 [Lentisphaeria bacterium]|jgi:hypothetical protein